MFCFLILRPSSKQIACVIIVSENIKLELPDLVAIWWSYGLLDSLKFQLQDTHQNASGNVIAHDNIKPGLLFIGRVMEPDRLNQTDLASLKFQFQNFHQTDSGSVNDFFFNIKLGFMESCLLDHSQTDSDDVTVRDDIKEIWERDGTWSPLKF